MREAPAWVTSRTLPRSIPPIANQGRSRAASAAWRTYESPAAGRPAFVGVSHTGPTLSWSATPDARRVVELLRRVSREPHQDLVAHERARLASRHVVLAHVHSVGGARLDQVRPVVQPEQRAVLVAQPPEHGGRAHELVVARLLVTELDHVHPAGERRREQLLEPWPYIGDEVQPRTREPLAAGIHYGLNVPVASALRTVLYAGRAVPSLRSSPASNRLSLGDCCQW